MELVEDSARSSLDIGCCNDGYAVPREGRCKPISALGIFEGCDAGSELAGFQDVRMCLMQRLAELEFSCGYQIALVWGPP